MAKEDYASYNGLRRQVKPKAAVIYWRIFLLLVTALLAYFFWRYLRSDNPSKAPVMSRQQQVEDKVLEAEKKLAHIVRNQKESPERTEPLLAKELRGTEQSQPTDTLTAGERQVLEARLKTAEKCLNVNPVVTRRLCLKIINNNKLSKEDNLYLQALYFLGDANIKIISTSVSFPEKKAAYTVQRNDGLQKIAQQHNTTIDMVQKSNAMKPTDYNVWEGKKLNVYKGEWRIVVNKSKRKLYLYDGKDIFKVYNVGIGKDGLTPEGKFYVAGKVKNPGWYTKSGKIIPYGDERNVLGTRWLKIMPLDKSKTFSGYGIHGTTDNSSIGKAMSNGCIRMKNSDVEELYSIVPRRTPVLIEK